MSVVSVTAVLTDERCLSDNSVNDDCCLSDSSDSVVTTVLAVGCCLFDSFDSVVTTMLTDK